MASVFAEQTSAITGTYEGNFPTDRKTEKRFLEITITEKTSKIFLSGSAGYSSGRSAAPDFSGTGFPTKTHPFKFTFEDSFGNSGIAVIRKTKSGVRFSVEIKDVQDTRCLPLYVESDLKRK